MRFAPSERLGLMARACIVATLAVAAPSFAAIGAGSLFVAGATTTPTHWNIPVGVPVTVEIHGVLASEVGGSLPATLTVFVKSSVLGNTTLTATRIGTSSDYSFMYTAPSNACGTTIVAYFQLGQNSNNDLCDDGLKNDSAHAASGLRFVNGQGNPISCEPLDTQGTTWGHLKTLYQDAGR